ncbi:polysaccharide deacetylase family protein [Pseudalkalibacillus berkeleyi]|uniref:Polysaccharide deacetylase family protein n=1 Tax=Pseudalkalibacillus berkeleyi TaxID=1069813 RepID=A0ABS9GYV8_9BACL|nr:polysaccharide deacetylase family protein [Pseudalkalibacillus berkeleyi]MCF6136946.1 polysaccharide deacetylase family protein [Pseudalkalibacillus berkeleyi]
MKKILLLLLVVLIAGCGPQTTDQSKEKKKEQSENTDTVHSEKESPEEDENDEGSGSHDEEKDSEEDPAAEDQTVQYTVHPANWTLKTEMETDSEKKTVLLTIDDAPDQHALEMAKKLKDLNVPAIFFVNGHFMDTEKEKEVVKEIYDLGFEIGNHTMSHSNLSKLSEEKQRVEIVQLSEEIESVTGEAPAFFRAPFGVNTDFSKELMKEQEMIFMNWTYGYDWEKEYQTSSSIADIMVNTPLLTDGAILLMHDRTWTNEALVEIVKGLRAKGYSFVNPDQIITGK